MKTVQFLVECATFSPQAGTWYLAMYPVTFSIVDAPTLVNDASVQSHECIVHMNVPLVGRSYDNITAGLLSLVRTSALFGQVRSGSFDAWGLYVVFDPQPKSVPGIAPTFEEIAQLVPEWAKQAVDALGQTPAHETATPAPPPG